MPITLGPTSRRQFLKGSLALGAGMIAATALRSFGEPTTQPASDASDRLLLLSDIHISGDAKKVDREVNMSDHLAAAVAAIGALAGPKSIGMFINGDLAYRDGQAADYAQMLSLLKPVSDAQIPITFSMGNHDHRERFRAAVPNMMNVVEGRQVSVIESPRATWVVLDTLDKTNVTPGIIGEAQLKWLTGFLDAPERASGGKPILLMTHHHPATLQGTKPPGIVDAQALMDALVPRKQVKAVLFGHTHVWDTKPIDGLHLINLPAVAYVFAKTQTSAWTDCRVDAKGCKLTLNTIDPKHANNGKEFAFAWR